ncbi:MAG: glycosyltransferase, partial [Pirellulales bacterium]
AVAAVEPGRDQPRPAAAPRVAVVGVLPPVSSGIAPYTLRHLQDAHWLTTFYAANGGARLERPRGVVPPSRILPAELLPAALARGRHDATVFVLGNSPHHIRVFEAMMRSRDMPGRRLLWLHEAGLETIFRAWLGNDADGLPSGEPPGDVPDWIARALAAKPKLSAGLRFLADHAALDGLIVNSAACRDLVRAALGPRADVWSIDVAFLPIEEPAGARAPMAGGDGTLRVGSFGHAGDPKRLDCVAQAVGLLDRTRPARLVVAGWEVGRYCRRTGINRLGYVDVSDAPDDAGLTDCMRRVDVAVQLRTPTFGESSGVVNELVAIGTPLVVTRVGSFAELPADLVTFVESTCSPAELAAAITAAAATRPSETARASFLAARSHAAFAATFAAVLAEQGLPATARDRAAACSPAAA